MSWRPSSCLQHTAVWLWLCVLAVWLCAPPGPAQTCGVASVFDLASLIGWDLSPEERQELVGAYPKAEVSMLDVQRAANSIGIALVGARAAFDELRSEVPGAKVIHLRDPDHFLVLARASQRWGQVVEHGRILIYSLEEIQERYTGHALVLEREEEPGGPRLQLHEFHHSFGIAGVGQQVQHAFKVTNLGDGDLAITLQAKGCRRPDASIGKELLRPGESTDVTVKLAVTHSGPLMKSVALLTNDVYQPVAYLTMHGKVPHDLRAYPDRLYVTGEKGQAMSRAVTVSGPADMQLKSVVCDKQFFDIQVGEPSVSADEKKTWHIELTFKPGGFVEKVDDQLSIHTTHPERPLITIPITGEIRGDLDAHPRTVFFGFVKPNAEASQDVLVRSRSLEAFQIKKATCQDGRITVGTPKRLDDGRWQVAVSVDTGQEGVVNSTVVLTTDVSGEERLEIPVYAHIVAEK